ncbi:uncharacterized protein LOC120703431 isoform X2 [Panicum virgatum]|uniref:uncharacterized protein LOC120703431 isoform X2 n=1 Tax=Panicum virgatum TaxID=38727 RepID=UPI0019D55495|nr:uncharacterized protein LOC120703431 isoform X2 [Panicum virgatum]
MDPLNDTRDEQREEKNRKWRESYQQEKVCAASMTDEQREEKNRKWREAYKRKKCHAHKKENMPVDSYTGNPITNASNVCVISAMAEHTSNFALLNRGSENILTPLKTVDKNNERNKKCREAYQKRSVETQNKSIPAERETFTEDHPYSDSPSVNLVKPNFTNGCTDVPPGWKGIGECQLRSSHCSMTTVLSVS